MQIIVCRDMPQFDDLAAMIAASRLYGRARMVMELPVSRPVRDFMALHKDRFPTIPAGGVDAARVSRGVLVNCRRASRFGALPALFERLTTPGNRIDLHIFDRAPPSDEDLVGTLEHIDAVGATVTLLVEFLHGRGVELAPIEATALLAGIYRATSSLTWPTTTARDADAVAWLLEKGACLQVVNRFVRSSFSDDQRGLLGSLFAQTTVQHINAGYVGVAPVSLDRVAGSLGEIVQQALRLEGLDALVAIFAMPRGRVQVIARSQVPQIEATALLASMHCTGDAEVASASFRDVDAAAVLDQVMQVLQDTALSPARVSQVMSTPVRTVAASLSLGELRDTLTKWKHSGAPVLVDGRLAGVVSRRDIAAHARRGTLDQPVSSAMTHHVLTVSSEATVEEALEMMTRGDVGRLPVLDGGKVVGILTRTDALRVLYGGPAPRASGETDAEAIPARVVASGA